MILSSLRQAIRETFQLLIFSWPLSSNNPLFLFSLLASSHITFQPLVLICSSQLNFFSLTPIYEEYRDAGIFSEEYFRQSLQCRCPYHCLSEVKLARFTLTFSWSLFYPTNLPLYNYALVQVPSFRLSVLDIQFSDSLCEVRVLFQQLPQNLFYLLLSFSFNCVLSREKTLVRSIEPRQVSSSPNNPRTVFS